MDVGTRTCEAEGKEERKKKMNEQKKKWIIF